MDDMLKETAENYAKFLKINMEEKLQPVNRTIEEMLARLEEFETMLVLVQQERCNAIGLTGNFAAITGCHEELTNLCQRIDALEKLVEHIKSNLNYLEGKLEAAEESYGHANNATKLKSLLMPILKRNEASRSDKSCDETMFKTEDYFKTQEETQTS